MRSADVAHLIESYAACDRDRFVATAKTIAANERRHGRPSAVADRIDRAIATTSSAAVTLGRAAAKFVMAVEGGAEPVLEPSTKAAVDRICAEHLATERLEAAGLVPVNSALFIGPPGVGKTMAATSIGTAAGLDTFVVSTESLVESLLGGTGQNLRVLFDEIVANRAVWVFDEFDSLARCRGGANDVKESDRIVNTILRMLDRPRRGLLVACTNLADSLDPAILSRFGEATVTFGPPSRSTIETLITATLDGIESEITPVELASRLGDIDSHRALVATLRRGAKTAVMAERSARYCDFE